MKKVSIICILLILCLQFNVNAQLRQKGTTFPSMTLTDIKGVTYDLDEYMNKGYAIIIEIALTTCKPCWQFKQSGFLNSIYEKYGPQGTVKKGKILPIFIEANINNSSDELYGKSGATEGNWVEGAKYPIVDLERGKDLLLLLDNSNAFATPSFYLICSDKKIFDAFTGITEVQGKINYDFIGNLDNCAKGSPTGIDDIALANSMKVYPSPGVQKIHVELSVDDALLQDITLVNIEGRSVVSLYEIHTTKTTVDVAGFPGGVYMLNMTLNDGRKLNRRVVIAE